MKTINVMFEEEEFKKMQKIKEEMKRELKTPILSWKNVIMIKLNLKNKSELKNGN